MMDDKPQLTTLCYIKCSDEYLLLHRNKKENDLNEGKWIGVGGKMEPGETPDDGAVREIYEETGIVLSKNQIQNIGVVHFKSDTWNDEEMFLYKVELASKPELIACDEGTLYWIQEDKVLSLPTWEGDRVFLEAMFAGETDIDITLSYEGDKLVQVIDHKK